jgi:O-acetyl-ADP-ribose deacetylase (regulator of RNase III)
VPERRVGASRLVVVQGDITLQDTDAIVNAANSTLLGGGGVDGAIHRAGGPSLHEECLAIVARQGGCPTGQAVITSGGLLKARFVIHAVGPVWRGGGHGEEDLLRDAYVASLDQVLTVGAGSVSFPSISTGVYGFPIERAARIAWNTVGDFVRAHGRPSEVRFIVFSRKDFEVYARLVDGFPSRA